MGARKEGGRVKAGKERERGGVRGCGRGRRRRKVEVGEVAVKEGSGKAGGSESCGRRRGAKAEELWKWEERDGRLWKGVGDGGSKPMEGERLQGRRNLKVKVGWKEREVERERFWRSFKTKR